MTVRAVEWKKPYKWWKAIEITEDKVINLRLRDENNLIIYDEWDNEIYVDLQLPDEITPTDAFPVWVTTGRVIVDNGWDWQGTIVCFKTTSWDNIKLLYADDWKLYIDNWTGTFKQIYLKWEVDALLQALRDYVDQQLALKQDKLIAWDRITINADGKTINADLQVNDTAYWSSWDWVTEIAPSKNAVYDKIESIDELIPSAAASNNQLADKNYVDDSINQVAAYYITKNAQWDAFATKSELTNATTFYSWWVQRTPTRNDFCIVLEDETHSGDCTRYSYQGSSWEYQYTVNETALTQAQLDALNSWITANKVSTYDWYASTISWKQDALTAGTGIGINSSNTISNTLPWPTVSATAPSSPSEWDLWYDTTNDVLKSYNGTSWEEWGTKMTVLTYGTSTWQDFVNAYNNNAIVYCKVASWSAWYRMAFMAYVTGQSTPTSVEFQYYRSRSDHNTQANQLDEIYVYKLESNWTWTTTTRDTGAKIVAWNNVSITRGSWNAVINASWWLQVAPNSPITWIKYVWYGTESDYSNLSQYYTDTPWDTEYRTF